MGQSLAERKNFGPFGSETRRENDPLLLARSADPAKTPYLMLTCGEQDSLLASSRGFASQLAQRHIQHVMHTTPGGHEWTQWNQQIPIVFAALQQRLGKEAQ
jgi:S-formylglutathione hydrolase FrmB